MCLLPKYEELNSDPEILHKTKLSTASVIPVILEDGRIPKSLRPASLAYTGANKSQTFKVAL